MRRVAVISYGYAWLPTESGPSRFYDIARILSENGYQVDLVGARFQHFEKKERETQRLWHKEWPFELYFIDAPHYRKNIGFRRIVSNHVAARNVKKFLEMHRGKYDVIYCSIPANNIAKTVAKFCHSYGIPLIVDIEDLWPEAMKMVMDIPVISNILYYPIKRDAEYTYSVADAVIGTSDEYAQRAVKNNKRNIPTYTVYVGCDIDNFDNAVRENEKFIVKDSSEFWVTYAGSIGKSYDIETLVFAAKEILKAGNRHIKIKILGAGPAKERLEDLARKEKITNIEFLGYVEYPKMAAYLHKSDVLINSFIKNAPQSIVNKVGDYLAAGKPMINTLESREFWNKVMQDGFGTNVEPENADALKTAIFDYYGNEIKCCSQGKIARKIAEEQFARKSSYKKIVEVLDGVCGNKSQAE